MPEGVGYGSNIVAGTGLELNIVGKFAYAYSGSMATNTSEQTALSFTTGNYVFVGRIQGTGPIHESTPANGRISTWRIELNGLVVGYIKADTTDDFEGTTPSYIKMVIPAYTKVEVFVDSNSTASDHFNSTVIEGRIYK